MTYYVDLYGVTADQETFLKREAELIDPVAERLMEVLDIDLVGSYSESRGGICYGPPIYRRGEKPELDVHLSPNRVIESDDDYWREERYQQFALLLHIGAERKEPIEAAREKILADKDLGLTLIRSKYNPDIEGAGRDVILYSLDAGDMAPVQEM